MARAMILYIWRKVVTVDRVRVVILHVLDVKFQRINAREEW